MWCMIEEMLIIIILIFLYFFCIKIVVETEVGLEIYTFQCIYRSTDIQLSLQISRSRMRDAERQHCSEFVKWCKSVLYLPISEEGKTLHTTVFSFALSYFSHSFLQIILTLISKNTILKKKYLSAIANFKISVSQMNRRLVKFSPYCTWYIRLTVSIIYASAPLSPHDTTEYCKVRSSYTTLL